MNWIYSLTTLLAQYTPDAGDSPAPDRSSHPLSFSDLQKGLRLSHEGNPNDRPFQVALLAMVAAIAIFALILHLRQRHKSGEAPDNAAKLAREISRHISFPLGSRMLLNRVAKMANVPAVTLMLSVGAFEQAVDHWGRLPTFGVFRQWGQRRLARLKPLLFESNP